MIVLLFIYWGGITEGSPLPIKNSAWAVGVPEGIDENVM